MCYNLFIVANQSFFLQVRPVAPEDRQSQRRIVRLYLCRRAIHHPFSLSSVK